MNKFPRRERSLRDRCQRKKKEKRRRKKAKRESGIGPSKTMYIYEPKT